MEIKNIYRVIAFELSVQLRSKSFWLLSLIPPVAVILIVTVNLQARQKSNIAVHNTSCVSVELENDERFEFFYVDPLLPMEPSLLDDGHYDALVKIYDREESGIGCEFHEIRLLTEDDKQNVISAVKSGMIKHALGEAYSQAIEKTGRDLSVSTVVYQNHFVLHGLSVSCIFLIYFVVLQFASSILGTMGKEKKNKISEILLTAMSSDDIMIGKLVSGFFAAVLQVSFWCLLAIGVLAVMGRFSNGLLNLETIRAIIVSIRVLPTKELIPFCVVFILSFTGGYFLYSTLFSFVGVISNENTNTRQFSLLLTIPLLLTFVYVVKNPNSDDAVMRFLTYFPLSSPIALLPGVVRGIPAWRVIISFFIIFVTIVVAIRYASKLYAHGIMATKTKVTLWTIVKWIREE